MSALTGIVYDLPEAESFWARVDKSGECWEWTRSRTSGGYGNVRLPSGRNGYAHRIAYTLTHGRIPEGLVLDHLCRNRRCVNPAHLEAVTSTENVRRGAGPYGAVRTACKHGHDITDSRNVYTDPSGNHRCRVCAELITRRNTEQRRARGDLRKILKTHCVHGHPFDDANTYVSPAGRRACRECTNIRARGYRKASR